MANDRLQVQNFNATARKTAWTASFAGTVTAGHIIYYAVYAPFAGTLDKLYAVSESGTGTVTVKKNGTSQTGLTGVAFSSTRATYTPSGLSFVAGDVLLITVASTSSGVNVGATLEITRTS
jgi:hypothetical protein